MKPIDVPGWMTKTELAWLSEQARTHRKIVELGSWRGRSTLALAQAAHDHGVVYAIDTWGGSIETANDPDLAGHGPGWLLGEFKKNTADCHNIVIVQSTFNQAAHDFARMMMQFDMVFIDGAHDYDSVRDDIIEWSVLLCDGGLLCGHDYNVWAGVSRAVDELVPNRLLAADSIWYRP